MILDLGWRCSYSEVRGELFWFLLHISSLPRFFCPAVTFLILYTETSSSFSSLQEEQHNKSSPFHILFFHLLNTRRSICVERDIDAVSAENWKTVVLPFWVGGQVQSLINDFKLPQNKLLSDSVGNLCCWDNLSAINHLLYSTLTSFNLSCSLECLYMNVSVSVCLSTSPIATNLLIYTVKILCFYSSCTCFCWF